MWPVRAPDSCSISNIVGGLESRGRHDQRRAANLVHRVFRVRTIAVGRIDCQTSTMAPTRAVANCVSSHSTSVWRPDAKPVAFSSFQAPKGRWRGGQSLPRIRVQVHRMFCCGKNRSVTIRPSSNGFGQNFWNSPYSATVHQLRRKHETCRLVGCDQSLSIPSNK